MKHSAELQSPRGTSPYDVPGITAFIRKVAVCRYIPISPTYGGMSACLSVCRRTLPTTGQPGVVPTTGQLGVRPTTGQSGAHTGLHTLDDVDVFSGHYTPFVQTGTEIQDLTHVYSV